MVANRIQQTQTAGQRLYRFPDHTQLPDEDGTFVKNFQEHPQSILLTDSIEPVLSQLHPDGQYCIGQDSGIYWNIEAVQTTYEESARGAVSPDWFYVPQVPPLLNGKVRRSYVLWHEPIRPLIVCEFVSGDGSEELDTTPKSGKFWVYEHVIRPQFYAIYYVNPGKVDVYVLKQGKFKLVLPNAHGHYPIPPLGVALGIWRGSYKSMLLPWLRWFTMQGVPLPTSNEREEHERKEKERAYEEREHERKEKERAYEEREHERKEKERAYEEREHERKEKERLIAQLRAMGIEPEL